jgi:8-oxo-dGTP diphosphatase
MNIHEMSPSRSRKSSRPQVRAAGGVVWRAAGDGGYEIVLVYRSRYDDWSFPKGKLDRGESYQQAALREVAEETGLFCALGDELTATRYRDGKGRDKLVRYWAMRVVDLRPWAPNHEITGRLWVPLEEVADMLTYDRDRKVLVGAEDAMGRL